MSFVTLKEAMPSFIKVFCLVGEHESNDIVYCIDNEHCINYYIHKAILEFEANVKHYILQRGETYEIEKLKTHHILRDAYKICKEVMKVTDSKRAPDILAHVISKRNCNLICFDTKPSLNYLSEYISHAISLMLIDFMVPSYTKASLFYNKSSCLVYAKNSIPRIETILEKMVLNIKDQEYWIGDVYEIKKLSNPINEYNNIICSIFDDEEPSPANIPCTTATEALKSVANSDEMKKTNGDIQTSLWLAVYKCYIKYVEDITLKDFSELLQVLGITQNDVTTHLSKGNNVIKSFDSDPQKWTYSTGAAKNKYVAVAKLFLAMIAKEK